MFFLLLEESQKVGVAMNDPVIRQVRMEDIPGLGRRGKPAKKEFEAVRNLEVDEAIAFDCQWRHGGPGGSSCYGVMNAQANARRKGFSIRATCKDGVVYVGRVA